jgi:methylenetetrahydrofolate dehydrogenase (NADP+)/methenyltetrahydrofolate cyclohydrolase
MQTIDGRKLASAITENIKEEISKLGFVPLFCDVLVGNDPASIQYVQMKAKTAEMVGIHFHKANFPAFISTDDLIKEIKILNKVKNMCGIIVQLPLPESLDQRAILDSIDSHLDVDCLGTIASEIFYSGETSLGFPTALACLAILDSLNLDLNPPAGGKKIVVLGQGVLVGKPVTALLRFRNLSPLIIRSKTENKEKIIKEADIIISGIGKGKYITGQMIKSGTVLIDAGTSESLGHSPTGEPKGGPSSGLGRASIVGDVDLESVKDVAGYVSPVPGGVGPVTVAMLLNNVLKVAKNISK